VPHPRRPRSLRPGSPGPSGQARGQVRFAYPRMTGADVERARSPFLGKSCQPRRSPRGRAQGFLIVCLHPGSFKGGARVVSHPEPGAARRYLGYVTLSDQSVVFGCAARQTPSHIVSIARWVRLGQISGKTLAPNGAVVWPSKTRAKLFACAFSCPPATGAASLPHPEIALAPPPRSLNSQSNRRC
jgi:hypothetical protein